MRKMDDSGKAGEQDAVELLRRGEIVAEWLLDDHARALGRAGVDELFHDLLEERWRDSEVVRRVLGVA